MQNTEIYILKNIYTYTEEQIKYNKKKIKKIKKITKTKTKIIKLFIDIICIIICNTNMITYMNTNNNRQQQ